MTRLVDTYMAKEMEMVNNISFKIKMMIIQDMIKETNIDKEVEVIVKVGAMTETIIY